jgi:hypothetical protein
MATAPVTPGEELKVSAGAQGTCMGGVAEGSGGVGSSGLQGYGGGGGSAATVSGKGFTIVAGAGGGAGGSDLALESGEYGGDVSECGDAGVYQRGSQMMPNDGGLIDGAVDPNGASGIAGGGGGGGGVAWGAGGSACVGPLPAFCYSCGGENGGTGSSAVTGTATEVSETISAADSFTNPETEISW